MKIRVQIVVSGLVQGVGFRYFAIRKAKEYSITGYVMNLPSGEVLCEAEGDEGLVHEFIDEIKMGPRFSHVTDAKIIKKEDLISYESFEVRF